MTDIQTTQTETIKERHKPVLLHEIIDTLALQPGMVVVDCNLGDGGHSEVIIKKLKGDVSILAFDLDQDAIARTKEYLSHMSQKELDALVPINANFSDMDTELQKRGYGPGSVDAIIFDLGLSTYDLIGSDKGFTFRKAEPLHMTFGAADAYLFTASDIVNEWAEEDIANVIYAYGEETHARKIARLIVGYRQDKRIETSKELADLIEARMGGGRTKTHPATKTFQALRIAVNNELEHLRKALEKALILLKPGGIMEVISYHSLEDRIVKQYFKQWAKDGLVKELTKKPTTPSDEELKTNPRSRSAKLRILQKIEAEER